MCVRWLYTKSNPIDDHSNIIFKQSYRSRISNHWATIPACNVVPPITPNKIPLTTIVVYLWKSNTSSISNQWACMQCGTSHLYTVQETLLSHIILATYRMFTVATVRFTQNDSCNIYIHPIYQQVAPLCNNSSDNKSYWIHRVDVKVTAQVTTITYMHQSFRIHLTVHLELWPGNHLIWCNTTFSCKQDAVYIYIRLRYSVSAHLGRVVCARAYVRVCVCLVGVLSRHRSYTFRQHFVFFVFFAGISVDGS